MDKTIKIRIGYITFSIFAIFLFTLGLLTNTNMTGFSIKGTEDDIWQAEFETKGKSDLTIDLLDGTGYSSRDDVKFISLQCGTDKIIPNILTNKIVYEGYECKEKTKIFFFINTEGKFRQKVTFGREIKIYSFKK